MSISWGAQYPKLKSNLRLAINRLKLMEKKKTEMAMKARTEIADYIAANKEDRARIRVEHIIREDYVVEAFEILEMYCDLLLARFGLIEQIQTLDDGIAEAVTSIIWAAPRVATDIPEFKPISDQLIIKYGKPFAEAARGNQLDFPAKVSPKLITKLSVTAPPKLLIERYMIEIAASAGVPFTPNADIMRDDEVAQAEKMLIDFKQAGGHSVPASLVPIANDFSSYGWNVPSRSMCDGGISQSNQPLLPTKHDSNRGGNIYEVPYGGSLANLSCPSDLVPSNASDFIQLPKIGSNGLPIYQVKDEANCPEFHQHSSVGDLKGKPSAPLQANCPPASMQSLKETDILNTDLAFPEPPRSFVGGGNSGNDDTNVKYDSDLDFDELARRFDQLKKRPP